jgi:hypothetical protein
MMEADMQLVAIDPGLDGGILSFDGGSGWLFDPMPVIQTRTPQPRQRVKSDPQNPSSPGPHSAKAGTWKKRAPRVRRWCDARRVADILNIFPGHVILEQQHPIKGQGLTSTGSIMRQFGLLEGILCGQKRAYTLIEARRWQMVMRVVGVKASSWIVMQRAQPDLAERVREHKEATRVACADCWCMIQTVLREGPQIAVRDPDDWLA